MALIQHSYRLLVFCICAGARSPTLFPRPPWLSLMVLVEAPTIHTAVLHLPEATCAALAFIRYISPDTTRAQFCTLILAATAVVGRFASLRGPEAMLLNKRSLRWLSAGREESGVRFDSIGNMSRERVQGCSKWAARPVKRNGQGVQTYPLPSEPRVERLRELRGRGPV